MIATPVVFSMSMLAISGLLYVSAEQPGGEIEERKPVPKEVKRLATDYADTILEAIQILSKDHIKKVSPAQLTNWAVHALYERSGERVPGDFARRLLALRDPDEEDLRDLLRDARQHLGKRAKLTEYRDMDLSLEGIFEHLEPGTKLRPLGEERMICRLLKSRCGIGVVVEKDEESGLLRVATPIKDSPAYKAGIRAGDVIEQIIGENEDEDGGTPRSVSTKALSLEQANESLCGKPGSQVRLILYRNDPTKRRRVEIVRAPYNREAVFGAHRKSDDTWDFLLDSKNKIVYIRIPGFTNETQREVARTLARLGRHRIKGLILDLRGNPGGLLHATVDCAELFLEKGSFVATIRGRQGKDQRIVTDSAGRFRSTPLVCLIDGGSRSSSETFAACLQDHHRAIMVGERSRGEAEVRRIVNLRHGELPFVVAAFYRPNGKPIGKVVASGKETDDWGVRPDDSYVVKLTSKERKDLAAHLRRLEIIAPNDSFRHASKPAFRDRQLEKALEYLRKQARHDRP
ncbi:MAG TPA: S41 family peptidase [Gemmataceae bacterium]|nr:S41 family peptidase [Gemmataceae bacterium]